MRAWRITAPGEATVLDLQSVPEPDMGPTDIRVRVEAVGLNRADILQRRGEYPAPPGYPADIPGLEYAGTVEAVGCRVLDRKVGDRVMGLVGGGAYAEQVVVHEREAIRVPDGMETLQAAAIPEAFLTAYRALFIEGGLDAGQWCVIRAATSGIGLAAMQLARHLGCKAVGTGRSAERLQRVREYGLDAVVVDGEGDLPATVRELSGGGAQVVLDLVGGNGALNDNLRCLRPEGTQVLVGLMGGRDDQVDLGRVLMRRLTLRAMTMRSLPLERRIPLARLFEQHLLPAFESGRIRPVVDTVLPFFKAREAHGLMESGRHTGKIVLSVQGNAHVQ